MEHFQLSVSGLGTIAQKSGGELSQYLCKQVWTPQDRECLLSSLAQMLLDKECTLLIGRQLRPLLLDLLERNAESIKAGGQVNHDLHERLCVAMSKLVTSHPDVLPFALQYFQTALPVFQRLFLESCDASTVRYGRRRMKLRDLMEAAYRFLQQDKSYFKETWDWSVCVPLLKSHDLAVRWYTAHCLALVTSMSDENRQTFLKKLFGTDELMHYKLQLLDELHSQNIEQGILLTNMEKSLWCKNKSQQYTQCQVVSSDLCSRVVPVCGIMLPKNNLNNGEQEIPSSPLVLVESTCRSLQSLAQAVSFQNAVLLEGPIGCGKTALVEHLATVTGRLKPPDILKVQLGDQTDSKMLLGMYRCTDIPGEFVWQPGTLTQAVANGYWILLEDIDYAPLDVISVLIPVLENGELIVPGRGDCLKVAPGFQLFATRRLLSSSSGTWYRPPNSHASLLDKLWTKIQVDNMTRSELKEVLQKLYPNLDLVIDRLLDIYIQLTGDKHQTSSILHADGSCDTSFPEGPKAEDKKLSLEGRGLSLRDLLKWCNRIAYNFDGSSSSTALNIFHEALDCFTAMLSKPGPKLKMAEIIGSKLNISKQKAEYYCQLYKPEIAVRELDVSVGRVEMLRKQTDTIRVHKEKITFAATRPSTILIEQIAVCVNKGEPVLLVGETGTGKTSTVQYLAHVAGQRLRIVNMNQQSDTADLLGGYKPVDHKLIWLPLREDFEELFTQSFSRKQNKTFLGHIQTCFSQKRWQDLLKLMQHVVKNAMTKVQGAESEYFEKMLKKKWETFSLRLNQAQQQMRMTENAVLFAFVEGTLAQAVKKGEWILLDEINLAAAETLECLCGLLEGSSGSLVLLDRGDTDPLLRHPDFRLFACMNPATDVGKRNLPPGIRNRFTELYVEELENESDLQILIADYLKGLNVNKTVVQGIISFYLAVRKKTNMELVDGTGHSPHYSLRTLCRALRYAASNPCSNIQRSLYEGFCLSFLTQLDRSSHSIVQGLICRHIVQSGNIKNLLKQPLPEPHGGRFVQIEGYWIPVGAKNPAIDESYILTPSVKLNLRDLVRVVSAGNHPVLLQGETSVGKTSLIRWLACASGNHCVRINNHEHTDIQEYIGCYTSDASGKLVFQEGILIDAMRKGYWIILDELNLAPTDVLEALNRLLDDNRELFITETQEVVKAHPRFMLFATQNPPGIYGGRKVLSRAFRNRFVELHYDELPSADLETILHKRCSLPPSYCNKLVAVMQELQSHRRGSSVFAGKHGFITLRDLFRWAERYRLSQQTNHEYDWLQHLANDGFMLLAGRVRKQEEAEVILKVLKKCFKKEVVPQALFSTENVQKQLERLSIKTGATDSNFSHIVWTQGMRRLAVLVGRALEFGEPILLVGDTGCGKTTICQLFAALSDQTLYSVNCHQHMETSDFLGGLRPVRHRSKSKDDMENTKLFEWHDGPLVLAMREDGFFLLDEISLADDSVLERLNSVLEVEKTLVLAEKGSEEDDGDVEFLTAGTKFRILATMNPGGDFGKKELSPALRNRFTEIWCPQSTNREDLLEIIKHNLSIRLYLDATDGNDGDIAELIMDFIEWLINQEFGRRCILSIRDVLSWVHFINVTADDMSVKEDIGTTLNAVMAFIHAACLVYIDGLGSGTTFCSAEAAVSARQKCMQFLQDKLSTIMELNEDVVSELHMYETSKERKISWLGDSFGIHPFYIPRGPNFDEEYLSNYALESQTTSMNAQRLLRALQLQKPILLEGSPGVGKTSLVTELAKASGNHLVRINLSEQTDVTDLFGTDLPIEGGKGGEFAWRDGPFLSALKAGHWIVLDELNLASQSVLEGLNACFDHRSEVYIPELGMTFQVQHEKTKIFGCQNPFRQGGGRKGLPRSFLNRFTQVFVDQLSPCDMEFIANALFPKFGEALVSKMVAFNNQINLEVMTQRKWGQKGGPWEFNLRDLFRWCQLMLHDQSPANFNPSQHVFLVYGERMRTKEDRQQVISVYKELFGQDHNPYMGTRQFYITPQIVQVGYSFLARSTECPSTPYRNLSLLHHSLQSLEAVMKCVEMNWMVILVGPAAVGKTGLVQLLALLTGNKLKVMAMNSAMDTTELLGGFEQADINRPWQQLLEKVGNAVTTLVRDSLLATDISPDTENLLRSWSHLNLNYKPKSVAEGGRGITTELLNKLESVLALIQRLNGKLNSFSKAEFAAILDHLHHFKDQLLNSVEGQSSGTFEWVDGMLVQALQSGDWLLMDNVNFCSSSVLDRLNALLEPGGVLTVSERGVIDGSTPTITPHPNFRLFFSMDPSHGEISRAMRNRGIEVYMSGDTDEVMYDSFDIKTLLHGFGIIGDHTCNALLAVHADIKETVVGSPCGSLSYLFHAASLISQQLQRGLALEQAFQRACSEVFIYSQRSLLAQKQVQEIITRHVCSLTPSDKGCVLSIGLWPNTVPSALFSAEDSLLSTILRDGQVLLYVLNRHSLQNNRNFPLALQDLEKIGQSSPTDNHLFSAVDLEAQWMDEPIVIQQSVKLVLEKSTSVDWMLRMRWLYHLAKNLPAEMDQIHTEIEAGAHALSKYYSSPLPKEMSSVMKSIRTFILDENCIPLDLRWNMQLLDIVKHCLCLDTGMEPEKELFSLLDNVTNRGIVLLNRQRQSYVETQSSRKLKRSCALKIAIDFHQDPAVHHDLPHPVVVHLVAFFDLWDMLVFECLQAIHTPLSNEATSELLCCLRWRDRFRELLETVGLETADLALLTFHWHWVTKYSLKPITQLFLGHEHHRLSQEVQSVSTSVQECLSSTQMPASVKLLQRILGRPLPFKEGSVVRCMDKLKALSSSLHVVDLRPAKGESGWQLEICRLKAASSYWETKLKLLKEWTSILRANHQEDVNTEKLLVSVELLSSHMKEQKIPLFPDKSNEDRSNDQMNQEELVQLASKVQMWPGLEYLMLLWQYKVMTDLLSHSYYVRKNMQSDLNQLVTYGLKHTSLPPQHLRAFDFLVQHSEITSGDVALLWSELICSVFSSFWDSTVSTDPDYWSSWKPTPSPDGSPTQVLLEPSVKGPAILSRAVFSNCFCEVLMNSSKTVPWDLSGNLTSHISLGEGKEKAHQLQMITSTLWTNMAVSSLASFRSTDSRLQGLLLYHHFVALKDLVPSTIQEEFLQYCDHLPSKDLSAYHYIQDILGDWSSQDKLPDDIIKLLLTCLQQFYSDVDESVRAAEAAHRGSLWINLGLLQINLWLPQTTFDPAIKRKYKLQYAEEELHQLECECKTRNLSSNLLTGKEIKDESLKKHIHPHISVLLRRIQKLKAVVQNLSKKQAYRPSNPSYDTLYQDVQNYLNSIGKMSSVQDFATRLQKALSGKGTKSRQALNNLLSEEAAWQRSHHQFRKRLGEDYSYFPDIVSPLQAAILQVQHGVRVMASELFITMNSTLISQNKITSLLTCLLAFPSTCDTFPTYFSRADSLCSVGSLDILKSLKKLSQKYPSKDQPTHGRDLCSCLTKEQLLVNGLLYLRSHVLCQGEMDEQSLELFQHINQAIVNEWDEQEQRARDREQEENSLFKYKTKSLGSGLTEDQEDENEFRLHFPTYEQDFADITTQPSLDEHMETETETGDGEAEDDVLVSEGSALALMLTHQQLCLSSARSLWYHQSPEQHSTKHYISLFLSCYKTSATIIENLYPLIGSEVNDNLLGSHLLASTLLQNTLSGNNSSHFILQQDGPYDFYQHSNIQQVRQCYHVLNNFLMEVNKRLEEWPEHPALVQLVVIIDRLQGFPLSSPLSKFLNGFEILLAKSQDWEENASSSLSLRKNLDEITQLIIQWRKLELNCWSLSLDNAAKRHAKKSNKHWFSIYQMIEKYLDSDKKQGKDSEESTLQSITKTLQAFIESSTLGEFQSRLQMLLVFHCHVLIAIDAEQKDPLCSLLWNLYHYYKQFLPSIQARITELRNPVEKELKDFVKISKWNDVSFWSVKQSVDKTHRTLFKFIKKFEAALCEPSCPALIESVQEQEMDFVDASADTKMKGSYIPRLTSVLQATLTRASSAPLNCGEDIFSSESLQDRLPKLTKKMRKLCTTFIKKSQMPVLFENLSEFTEGIAESVKELQSFTVNQTADKEKQKSEAKNILLQKRRALSELFKMLAKSGLSYRKGLSWIRTKNNQDILCLHPLDVNSALTISNKVKTSAELLAEITATWDGCHKYFYRSLARISRLETALVSPAKELELGNIERCKGFSGHLLKVLVKQRSSLTSITEQWIVFRNMLSSIQEIHSRLDTSNDYKIAFPPQEGVKQWLDRLRHLVTQCSVVLNELSWFLECCPVKTNEGEDVKMAPELNNLSPATADWLPKLCTMHKLDNDWQKLSRSVTKMLGDIRNSKAAMDEIQPQPGGTPFYSWTNFEACSAAVDTMQEIALDLRDVELLFVLPETEVKEVAQHMMFLKSIHYLREEIRIAGREFSLWKSRLQAIGRAKRNQESDEKYVQDFSDQVEATIKKILYAIQTLGEKSVVKENQETVKREDGVEENTMDSLQEGLITRLLTEDLCRDLKALDVQAVISAVTKLFERLKTYGEDIRDKHLFFNQCCGLLVRLLPMLSAYSDLLLFYLTVSLATHRETGKLLSVLTQIFAELAQKGFCLPKDLIEDAAGEGATAFHDYEGGGIGEGEGMKDVSNKIENEDQVEDTMQKGQEKEEDHDSKPDIKEEENAIEMSEDFDGKMHEGDKEKQDEEDEQSDNEEDDLDKQMGDLGDTEADKLDERLWGDDDDEEENDDEDKTEEQGQGMDTGESALVAKDDNQDGGNLDKDKKQNSKDEANKEQAEDGQKDKIHEQIDEREYDDNEVDPYHGKQDTRQEPESLDLPDELNLENDGGKDSGDEKDENGEEGNPFDIDEKPMEVNEEKKEQEDGGEENSVKEVQESEETEQAADQDKNKEELLQEEGPQEPEEETGQNQGEKIPDATKEEDNENNDKHENELPSEQGVMPQDDEKSENEVQDSSERMEHETYGKTAEDNLQSEEAAELAGAASERDEAKEEHGTGSADASQSEGHESKLMARLASQKQSMRNTQSFKRKPGEVDDDRTLGDHNERVHKRLRTMDSTTDMGRDDKQAQQHAEEADAYEHIKQGAESYDAQTYDTASKEQEKFQPRNEEQDDIAAQDVEMEAQEAETLETVNVERLKPEEQRSIESKTQGPKETELDWQGVTVEDYDIHNKEVDPKRMEKRDRSTESTIHTVWEFLKEGSALAPENPEELRRELEKQLEEWQTHPIGDPEEEKAASEMWQRYILLTGSLSQQLCEQLRLILEPTQAAKLKGDYRTGKRLNMRKVIPYIASQFRKDKIWLRRTKPSKRQYQICLAIDDSASMVDNHSKQLAYEALAVIGNALTLLEVGQIAVYSFGENVKLLHPFHEQFSEQSGSRILSQCKFQQKKTLLAQFLESSIPMFAAAQRFSQNTNPETAQLLIIVSDGRGIFVEGKDRVTNAVQAARNANIFIIFIILDNPMSKDSILDIKVPIFTNPKEMPKMISYMEQFPFPFYIILRDVNALPETLSDALRQWFELVTTSEHL